MAPFSMRCNTCGEWIHKGKKFNARKEDAIGEKYLTIQIFRFYIRCPRCSAEISFKTDPENTDYICETGAARNFEPWRDEKNAVEDARQLKEKEEEHNPMKALENRTDASRLEIQNLDALDEIRSINALKEGVTFKDVLAWVTKNAEEEEDVEGEGEELQEEQLVKAVFSADSTYVRRLAEEPEEEDEEDQDQDGGDQDGEERPRNGPAHHKQVFFAAARKQAANSEAEDGSRKRGPTDTLLSEAQQPAAKKAKPLPLLVKKPAAAPKPPPVTALSLLGSYADSDEE